MHHFGKLVNGVLLRLPLKKEYTMIRTIIVPITLEIVQLITYFKKIIVYYLIDSFWVCLFSYFTIGMYMKQFAGMFIFNISYAKAANRGIRTLNT